jgi:asparagine synthase (glutamine-hydrolysing)
MPGIVGLITKIPRERAEPELLGMVAALRHESFYETGTWVDEASGVYVGWAARKGSFSDGMPVQNERGNLSLVFSGEEFPEPETISRLKREGHSLRSPGASYLVHLAEENSTFPAALNGRFHGLLTDRTQAAATLFNDRYGMHRVYYHESKDAFYFAAEAKAILAVRPELRKADPQGLGELITCGCVLENRSIFDGLQVLPPGSAWVFRNGSVARKASYFEPREWEEQEQLDPETYYQQLREVFGQILPRYFAGPEKIGISLTGGLDSRMIMAWHKSPPGSLPCYSFGGSYRDCQDVVIARKVAKACGQSHEVIPVAGEYLCAFPHYAERTVYLTDGCVETSHSPDLFVNERARQIAPARMTGNYGGEVLRRVRAFKPGLPPAGLFRTDLEPYFKQARATYDELIRTHPLSFAVFRQAPWHHYGLLSLEQTQLALRSPFLDNRLVKKVFQAPDSACRDNEVSLRLIEDGNPALKKIRTDRGLAGNHNALVSAWNHAFFEFTYKAEYAYDYGMPQWVAGVDHALSPLHLERLFLGRQKFYHFRVWYRDRLSAYVREILLDRRTLSRPYLNSKKVEEVVEGHLQRGRNYTTEIHKLLTLELMHRLFLDPQ